MAVLDYAQDIRDIIRSSMKERRGEGDRGSWVEDVCLLKAKRL